ncbi:MAG: DNA-directed RNA polymerase subunit omega [Bacillota bacterium]|nr:DNA-directed RNA polymerase subunit omega [Bacillota bacterium]
MLVKPPLEKLLPKVENRYTLAILVAKRARQLVDGAMPLMHSDSPNLVTVACEELGSNRISCVRGLVNPYIPLRPEIEAARLAARHAAAQASMADAVKEELERAGNMINEPMDESDVSLLSEMLMKNSEAPDDEEDTEDAADVDVEAVIADEDASEGDTGDEDDTEDAWDEDNQPEEQEDKV